MASGEMMRERHRFVAWSVSWLDMLGKLLAAPFTARPVPGALCSAPLLWDEVDDTLELRRFTMKTLPERMSVFGRDPLAPVLTEKPDGLWHFDIEWKRIRVLIDGGSGRNDP